MSLFIGTPYHLFIQEMEMALLKPKKKPEEKPAVPVHKPVATVMPVMPTPTSEDEIDRIKRENKLKEARESAAAVRV